MVGPGEIRNRLLVVSQACTLNAEDCAGAVDAPRPTRDAREEADVALAAKNWTQAALAAAQAYKTLGQPTGAHR